MIFGESSKEAERYGTELLLRVKLPPIPSSIDKIGSMGLLQNQIDRRSFPHLYSAWWIVLFFVLMLVPGIWAELWGRAHPDRAEELMGFGMFWGLVIVPFFLALIFTSLVIQIIKFVQFTKSKKQR